MLDLAINHKEALIQLHRDIRFNEKYKFYQGQFEEEFEVDTSTEKIHAFASVTTDGEVIGYISYGINRYCNNVTYIAAVNFSDNTVTFGKDLIRAIKDIFEKFHFYKINFDVIIGNPAEKGYDKIVDLFHGRVAGTFKHQTRLFDGKIYDTKTYEITEDDYRKYKKNHNENGKQDMSGTCEFKYNEYWQDTNVHRTMSEAKWREWYNAHCGKCKYMCEICMYDENEDGPCDDEPENFWQARDAIDQSRKKYDMSNTCEFIYCRSHSFDRYLIPGWHDLHEVFCARCIHYIDRFCTYYTKDNSTQC